LQTLAPAEAAGVCDVKAGYRRERLGTVSVAATLAIGIAWVTATAAGIAAVSNGSTAGSLPRPELSGRYLLGEAIFG
jgi:hypothetical protein